MENNDLFSRFLTESLEGEALSWRTRALTAKSYKNVKHSLRDTETNDELATYGDALLKFALCDFLLDDEDPKSLSETKKDYESDRVLVDKVARHYDLIRYIRFDRENRRIPQNYDYEDESHKYIATALEALLGAHFKVYGSLSDIQHIVIDWIKIVNRK